MAAVEIFTNNGTTTVTSLNGGAAAPVSGTSQTWTVTSSATFPAAATGVSQFHVGDPAQPSELIAVTSVSGNSWTVTRGAEGTTPVAHAAGFTVDQVITAGGLNALVSSAAATAYAVVTGGTASSTPFQTVASLGSSGQVLTSNGAGLLPSFQAATGGTGLTNPMTTLGDTITGGTAGTPLRLAGNLTAAKEFLTSTGNGGTAAAPVWGTIASADVPTLNQNTTGTASNVTGVVAIVNGGTGGTAKTAAFNALSPNAALGDITYGSGVNTSTNLTGNTTTAKQFLTQTGAGGGTSAAPVWGTIASADMPAGTTSAQGALQVNGSAATIAAIGVAAAGNSPQAAAANHIHPDLSLALAPAGAGAESFPRRYATASQTAGSTGNLYVTAIGMPAGVAVNNITMVTATTAVFNGTHGWYVLLDSNLIVRAVTADQGNGTAASVTTWGTTSTVYTLATNSYTTTYAGLYYVGVMVAVSGGTVPTFLGPTATSTSVTGIAPFLDGLSSGSQTIPPAAGATMATLSNEARTFYAYTT